MIPKSYIMTKKIIIVAMISKTRGHQNLSTVFYIKSVIRKDCLLMQYVLQGFRVLSVSITVPCCGVRVRICLFPGAGMQLKCFAPDLASRSRSWSSSAISLGSAAASLAPAGRKNFRPASRAAVLREAILA